MKWLVALAFLFPCVAFAMPSDRQLPWMAGQTWWCSQDWDNCSWPYTHCGRKAWDFNWGSGNNDFDLPLLAPSTGVVSYAGNTGGGYGKVVLIRYPDGDYDRIAHCDALLVAPGEEVKQGRVVALCGGSGGWPVHVHINGQNNDNPADNGAFITCYFHYIHDGQENWGRPIGCRCDQDDGQHRYTSLNDGVFDRAESEYASIINNLGGRGSNPPNWWYTWSGGQTDNCYVQGYRGIPWVGAVVYDASNGAPKAYPVVKGFWNWWRMNGDGSDSDGDNGPHSDMGMPITPEYVSGTYTYQDGTKKYLRYRQGDSPEITCRSYTQGVAPGAFSDGWHDNTSYRVALSYEKNGRRSTMGQPVGPVSGVGAGHYRQGFSGGSYGSCWIELDTNSSSYADRIRGLVQYDGREVQPVGAFLVRTGFRQYWERPGQGYTGVGTAITDEFSGHGFASNQWFIRWDGDHWTWVELRWNGSSVSKVTKAWPGQFAPLQEPEITLDQKHDASTSGIQPLFLVMTPNPTTGQSDIRLGLPVLARGQLALFDLTGRMVRAFPLTNTETNQAIDWDGKDEHGNSLPSGVYFLRLSTPSESVTRRITVLR